MEQFNKISLSSEELHELIGKACDYALLTGMGLRSLTYYKTDCIQFAPFMLFPSSFPREEFKNACDTQFLLNSLMHKVSNDHEFLKEHLYDVVQVDSFTRNLYNIYETIYKEGVTQDLSLTLMRSDLMLNSVCPEEPKCIKKKPYCCWKQVEINTIASGHGWLGPSCTKLHRFILQQLHMTDKIKNLPENNALTGICSGMVETWKMYGDLRAIVLFVIEKKPYNICDQRMHEFEITRLCPSIRVIRRTLEELVDEARLGPNKELIVNNYTVALVYYRSGYSPEHYPTTKEWDVRLLIERSKAVKCPTIQYHLIGTKKIQQALTKPESIKRFLKDSSSVNKIKKIFTAFPNCIQATAKYEVGNELREIFFFREGTIVMWNIPELECGNLLQFLKPYEEGCYSNHIVQAEREIMAYTYTNVGKRSHLKDGDIILDQEAALDKYAFSNAISQSVKLGIWEASLDNYVDSIEYITEDLKAGRRIQMTREEVLRKQGELFALRHLINLSSDLLDTPEFYWERDDLEILYQQTCAYFNIAKRTRVMNEKLNHCVELVELLSSHLSDRHHVRLEWMIIVLIMVEVGFEIAHYIDRYFERHESSVYELKSRIEV